MRIDERIKVNDEIRILSKYNEVDSATCGRFRVMSKSDAFVTKQLEKLQNMIQERNDKLQILEERITLIDSGALDDELEAIVKKNTEEAKEKTDVTKLKKMLEKDQQVIDAKNSKIYYDMEKKGDKMDKSWYFNSALKHLGNANNSIPEYMQRELSKMPSNTGYIWKSVYCFGERPANSSMFTMTDNRKGMKIIHRWDKQYHSVYHKEGKKDEIRISHVVRGQK